MLVLSPTAVAKNLDSPIIKGQPQLLIPVPSESREKKTHDEIFLSLLTILHPIEIDFLKKKKPLISANVLLPGYHFFSITYKEQRLLTL